MSDTTSFTNKRDSFIAGVSVRGTVALLVSSTVCGAQLFGIEVVEPLKTIAVVIFGYYFLTQREAK
jgi:hypothetical protein